MRQTVLHIAQPCHESWAAMTPTAAGRHCAACQKTVVDFTQKTDAEILAYLANAAGRRTCGRFAAGQLERPLQRAAPAAPRARWRAWLAAAVAVWGARETAGTKAQAQTPTELYSQHDKPVSMPVYLQAARKPDYEGQNVKTGVVRGVVKDYGTGEGIPGVSVIIKGTQVGISTNTDGTFELMVPAEYAASGAVTLQVSSIGYVTQEQRALLADAEQQLQFRLGYDIKGGFGYTITPPAPWHPRQFYYWGKYWITRPFSR